MSNRTCPWSGAEFAPVTRGGNEKVFASSTARQEAHLACRKFSEHLIATGFISWETVRAWYDRQTQEGSNGQGA